MATDGKSLLRGLREVLNEASGSEFLDDRTSYEYLYEAAIELTSRLNATTTTQDITTVAGTQSYTLNADYLKLYLRNKDGNYYAKHNDGTADTFILLKEKSDIIFQNSTASSQPNGFYLEDDPNLDTQLSSTTTSAGASSGGQATLTDTTADFSDVSAGDIVHNTSDGSDGYVLSKTSSTVLVTALFGGTDDDYTSGDSYVIQPQGRIRLVMTPPPDTSAETLTVYYVKRPDPVFSDYGVYLFQPQHLRALYMYAAWLYKYRDSDPSFGDRYFQFFDRHTRQAGRDLNQGLRRTGFSVNLKGRK